MTKAPTNVFIEVVKGLKPIATSMIEKHTGIDINVNGEIAYEIAYQELSKKHVLMFDDTERMNIDICEFLGFINEFIEQKKMKVIIVANEKEINISRNNKNNELKYLVAMNEKFTLLNDIEPYKHYERNEQKKTEKEQLINNVEILNKSTDLMFGDDKLYKQMKEKVIGKTIKYKPELKIIIEKLIDDINENNYLYDYKNILENNIDFVVNALVKEQHENIRTFKFILENFDLYIKNMNNESLYKNKGGLKEKYINDIYKGIVYCTIVYKKTGRLDKNKNGELISTVKSRFQTKQSIADYKKFISVEQMVTSSLISNKDIIIKDYNDFEKAYSDNGYLIDNWDVEKICCGNYLIEDDKFIEDVIQKLDDKYKKEKFSFLSALLSLKILCIFKYKIGFTVDFFEDLVKSIKEDINDSKDTRKEISSSYYPTSLIYDNYADSTEEFIDYTSTFNELIKQRNFELETKIRNENYTIENYGFEFREDLNKMILNSRTNIIATTNFSKFENLIYRGNNENLQKLKWAIEEIFEKYRYKWKGDVNTSINEIKELQKVLDEVKNKTDKTTEKLKISILDDFIKETNNYINILNEMKDEQDKINKN